MEGGSTVALATSSGLSRSSLDRHRANHLKVSPTAVSEAKNAFTIIGYAHKLYERAERVLDRAEAMLEGEDAGSRAVLAAAGSLREVRASIELLARLVVVEPETDNAARNAALDARITLELERLVLPELEASSIEDALIVEGDVSHPVAL